MIADTARQDGAEREEFGPRLGLVLPRLGLGALVLTNGVRKFGWWGGAGLDSLTRRVDALYPASSPPVDAVIAAVWAGLEVIVGLALLLGIATRLWAGLYFLVAMLSLLTALGGVSDVRLGFEHKLLIALVTAAYALGGAGALSVDAWWRQRKMERHEAPSSASVLPPSAEAPRPRAPSPPPPPID